MTEQTTTTTRKRAPRKTTTVKNTDEQVNIETKEEAVKEVVKRELTDDTKVTIMNNTMGVYGYRNGNKAISLSSYGDTAKLTFEEVQSMYAKASTKRDIQDAFIIILDEDVIEEMNLTKLYKNILQPVGVDELFKNPERLQEVLPEMPKIMQETVVIQARRRFQTEDIQQRLTDIRIVQVIENITGINILPEN